MLESGAIYRSLPPHALAFDDGMGVDEVDWPLVNAQTWDCYGAQFSTLEYDYLATLDCVASVGPDHRRIEGVYLFTAAHLGDGFSRVPEQAKEFTFIALENGRLTIQPTDRVVFRERSFTGPTMTFPTDLKRQTTIWSCE
jgi:hypothetical protein